ncbi:MAG: glucosaminidase domain-containing protein [Lentimicrobium sp.]|nr:glucosaminidase domain-containing protein [Lentimicrobium sp.]
MKRIYPLCLIFFLIIMYSGNTSAQTGPRLAYKDYIEQYREIAVRKMKEYHIPASITLAQGILESGTGKSALAVEANNHFGIKCHKEWTGMTYTMDDDEKNECFRKYASAEESFDDHSYFLTSRPRYAGLFELDLSDYKGWAHGLKSAGYATNPRYAEILIRIIEENELFLYDNPDPELLTEKKDKKPKAKKEVKQSLIASTGLKLTPTELTFVEVYDGNRNVYLNNGSKLTFARNGDDIYTISKDFGVHAFQILKYNELGKKESITEGQAIYIVPKKNKSKQSDHKVSEGETMRSISQYYGIKLNSLYRLNSMPSGHEPQAGAKIKLKK